MGTDFSIIIPNFNKGEFVVETINSILSQTFINWEIIFVDDNSTDNSVEVINSFNDNRIYLTQLSENKGASYCRNYGFSISKGEYVIFLDSDDILLEKALEERYIAVRKSITYDFFVFELAEFTDDYRKPTKERELSNSNFLENHLSLREPWQTAQSVWKRAFFEKLGGFNDSYKRFQDIELHSRAIIKTDNFKIVNGEYSLLFRQFNYERIMSQSFAMIFIESSLKFIKEFRTRTNLLTPFRQTIFSTFIVYIRANQKGVLSNENKIMFNDSFLSDSAIDGIYNIFEVFIFRLMMYFSNQRVVKLKGVSFINKYIFRN